ncbi:hypothetical protein Y88_0104 [Novosphingobium nitrogenifigens DSM 19370]|uniref:Putative DNA-binding domain-containing protein n=1 Tax=Novosphingobium nitrogenifigens DSM 19370 TaxID=983920 RepID=F1ZB81_9SPHN|nr:DNA-binding domain-containing protein [Novosphingobium nitrogenifigens]EGD58052.1 hypothetical protein Y88_0104 [Novosphingobium nitrogenifigens DSM 19370]
MSTPTILPLAELQRRFCAWLREPDEDRASEQAAVLGVGPGLSVYQNNYRVTLVEALRETHGRAALYLGESDFDAAAAHHVDARPPSSWTLDAYGDGFPDTLTALWPDRPEAGELAMIDRAVGDTFVAPDAEPIAPAALGEVDWDTARITLVPSLLLLEIATNADELWLALTHDEGAHDEGSPASQILPQPQTLVIWRQGFEPVLRRADAMETRVMRQCAQGLTFAEICADLAGDHDEDVAVNMAGTLLGQWLGEGLVAAIG